MQIKVQCSKKLFQNFLSQEAVASGNSIGKELQKPGPKLNII